MFLCHVWVPRRTRRVQATVLQTVVNLFVLIISSTNLNTSLRKGLAVVFSKRFENRADSDTDRQQTTVEALQGYRTGDHVGPASGLSVASLHNVGVLRNLGLRFG